ncbi:MAG TPA: LPS assembly protein LptD [Acidiferrobacter sp.]|nr:LPS assembly protein LptD [Acidiferrobacter sp.]
MPRTVAARSSVGLMLSIMLFCSAGAAICPSIPAHPTPFMGVHKGDQVVHVVADKARAFQDGISIFSGHVVLTYGSEIIRARLLRFNRLTNAFTAVGHVHVTNGKGGVLRAHYLHLNRATGHGVVRAARFILPGSGARGRAVMVILRGRHKSDISHTRYTLCPEGTKVWYINAETLHLNYNEDVGVATNAKVVFKGVPIFYWPYLSFPISTKRKSGFLAPRYGTASNAGLILSVPYYWNLAPNYDLTTTPEILSRRGLLLHGHFRYLGVGYNGSDDVYYIPRDRVYGGDRYALALVHSETFNSYWWASVNYNRVSDPAFYADLSTNLVLASQVDLPQLGEIGYSGRRVRAQIVSSSYQLLDTTVGPAYQPYQELPGLFLQAQSTAKPDVLHYSLQASAVRFVAGNGPPTNRLDLYPSVSLPWRWPAGFLTPKFALRETDYEVSGQPSIRRTVPVASLKGGLMFERAFASGVRETLQPEISYLYIPYRNQQNIPIFDTAPAPFTYMDLFRTNAFFGPDRVVDTNQATAGLTTRVYSASGRERLRASIGEIYYFRKPTIYLAPQTQVLNWVSDLAAEADARLTRHWYVRGNLAWNPNNDQTDAGDAYLEYHPRPNAIVTLGHRYIRGVQEQVDASFQWPVTLRWSALAETSYSLMQSSSLGSYLGVKYNSCCWGLGFYVGKTIGLNDTQFTTIMFQFTLNGLGALGSAPIVPLSQHGFMLGP